VSALSAIVVFTYLVINYSKLPVLVLLTFGLADIFLAVVSQFIFSQATEVHLLSARVINRYLSESQRTSSADRKFWEGMKPLSVAVGEVCSFETKEFLLFIWAEVIISKIIDLLVAF